MKLTFDLPGFKKENVTARLENGYLTIQASKGLDKDKEDKEGKYIRRERYSGSCRRSFHIGDNLKEEDIRASFENGMLKLVFPKEEQRKAVEEKKYNCY